MNARYSLDTNSTVFAWNGTNLTSLNVTNQITYMSAVGRDLYVAGTFTNIGGVDASGIAKWDSTNWSALGSGITGIVATMCPSASGLVVGGAFTQAGGLAATNIARWDGTNWAPIGTGLGTQYGNVYSVAATDQYIFAGGLFYNTGSEGIRHVARWNGIKWEAMDTLDEDDYLIMTQLTSVGNRVYGILEPLVNFWPPAIVFAEGTNWQYLPHLLSDDALAIRAMASDGANLYAGGQFLKGQSNVLNSIGRWTGTNWESLQGGVLANEGYARAIAVAGSNVFIGGNFSQYGPAACSNMVRWDGSNWWPLGLGVDAPVLAAVASNNNVYVGGQFLNAGGQPARRVARWNGSKWSPLGNGVNFKVDHLTFFQGQLVAAGVGMNPNVAMITNPICQWNGSNWVRLASADNKMHVREVLDVAAGKRKLFAVAHTREGNALGYYLPLQWDGTNWSRLGPLYGGGSFYRLAIGPDGLYGAGTFNGGDGLARWTGSNWIAVGSATNRAIGFFGPLRSFNDDLYLAGSIWHHFSSGSQVDSILRWDGLEWSSIGLGYDSVLDIAADERNFYAVGRFWRFVDAPPYISYAALAIRTRPAAVPELRLRRHPGQIQISWPSALSNHVLESSSRLPNSNWTRVANAPVVTGSRRVVTNQTDLSARFYRLRQLP